MSGTVLLVLLAACTGPGIIQEDISLEPRNPTGWNGYKVYLSYPRHASSGNRGECGWEENANGGHWNFSSAAVDGGGYGAFVDRGYKTRVSASLRDDGWLQNRNASDAWGAHVHLVAHTNAPGGGCPQSANYLLVMFVSGNNNSLALTDELIEGLDPVFPGGSNSWACTVGECSAQAAHRAYVELLFHTNQSAVNWFQDGYPGNDASPTNGWLYARAVDRHLGYPR